MYRNSANIYMVQLFMQLKKGGKIRNDKKFHKYHFVLFSLTYYQNPDFKIQTCVEETFVRTIKTTNYMCMNVLPAGGREGHAGLCVYLRGSSGGV